MILISQLPTLQTLISQYPNTYDVGKGICIGKALGSLDEEQGVGVVEVIVMMR